VRTRLQLTAQLAPFGVMTALLLVAPLLLLLTHSFRESSFLGVGGGPTLEQYELVLGSAGTIAVMLKTLYVGLAVAAISIVLAFVIAYAITFRMSPRTAAVALGIVVASGVASFLVRIFAWGIVLGTNGLVNRTLEALGAIESPLGFLYFGHFAIAVTLVYVNLPIAVLVVHSSMQGIDRHSVEASRDLGAGRFRTASRIVAPQSRVGILAAFAIVLMLASGDFVTPHIVGGTQGTMVGAQVQDLAQTAGDLPGAAALAISFLALALLAIVAIAVAILLTRPLARALDRRTHRLAPRLRARLPARSSRLSLSLPLAFASLVYLSLPTILVLVFSFNAADSIGLPLTGLTTDWYPEIVERLGFSDALRGTLAVAAAATIGSLLVGIPVAFALLRLSEAWRRVVWAALLVPFAIPGALLGSALLIGSSETNLPTGLTMTSAVHIALLVPIVVIVVFARLQGLDAHLTEAARDLGATAWQALRTVTSPLLRTAVLGAAVLAAAYSLDEVFVTQFTVGSASTLPVWLLGQARRGFSPGVYALGVLLLASTLLAFGAAALASRRTRLATGRGR
jgi:putative spermidine/putrescine transport system permease protein